ncbi:MAG: aryl-sulfate sulfotransferase [Flavobacteriales bacterium]|nr:aryl-sulfate sulfotransferase [Flavobacteriales bacterium]
MLKYLTVIITGLLTTNLLAQNTIGLISYDKELSFEGYNLIFPHNQQTVFLLNNCGEVVHKWEDFIYKPGNSVYLLENGDLIRCGRSANLGPATNISAGGAGEMVERRNWDGDLLWRYTYKNFNVRMHHDVEILPNGNILILAWEKKNLSECIAHGRDSNTLSENELWPDHLIEVEPVGLDSANIVWEWHAWDHLVQELDSTKLNYGIVSEHPELIDINYDNNNQKADWMHCNSIDYNEELDQILISVPTFNEIWIIDHSTTTAEAASHSGGNSGKGGDLIYRWGNPSAYHRGDSTDQKLFFQHDAQWNKSFLTDTNNYFNMISVYNNRVNYQYSSVNVINPVFNTSTQSYELNNTFAPNDFEWTYVHPDTAKMKSFGLSSVQKLPNNNTLICVGVKGYLFEITPNEEIVWEYINPFHEGTPSFQGAIPGTIVNIFNLKRYPTTYSAFVGKDLSKKGYIELGPNETFCETISVDEVSTKDFVLYPNPTSNNITLDFDQNDTYQIRIIDAQGRMLIENQLQGNHIKIDISEFNAGIYFVKINDSLTKKIYVKN